MGKDNKDLNRKASKYLSQIHDWLVENALELAVEKTEMVVLSGPRKRDDITIKVRDRKVERSEEISEVSRSMAKYPELLRSPPV